MKIFLIIIMALALLLSLFLFLPTNFIFEFSKDRRSKNFEVTIRHLFIKIKLKPPKKKGTKKNPNPQNKGLTLTEKIDKGISLFKTIEDDIADVLSFASDRAIKIKEFNFLMDFGTGDPMQTGIITGGAYGVIYNIVAILNNTLTVKNCDIVINPDFEDKFLSVSAGCILEVRNVHIMIMIFKVLKMYLKINKMSKGKED